MPCRALQGLGALDDVALRVFIRFRAYKTEGCFGQRSGFRVSARAPAEKVGKQHMYIAYMVTSLECGLFLVSYYKAAPIIWYFKRGESSEN